MERKNSGVAQKKEAVWAMRRKNRCVAQREENNWAMERKNSCVAQREEIEWAMERNFGGAGSKKVMEIPPSGGMRSRNCPCMP